MSWEDTLKGQKPDYPDLDGDGDTEEPMVDALETVEQVESVEKGAPEDYTIEILTFIVESNEMIIDLMKKTSDFVENREESELVEQLSEFMKILKLPFNHLRKMKEVLDSQRELA